MEDRDVRRAVMPASSCCLRRAAVPGSDRRFPGARRRHLVGRLYCPRIIEAVGQLQQNSDAVVADRRTCQALRALSARVPPPPRSPRSRRAATCSAPVSCQFTEAKSGRTVQERTAATRSAGTEEPALPWSPLAASQAPHGAPRSAPPPTARRPECPLRWSPCMQMHRIRSSRGHRRTSVARASAVTGNAGCASRPRAPFTHAFSSTHRSRARVRAKVGRLRGPDLLRVEMQWRLAVVCHTARTGISRRCPVCWSRWPGSSRGRRWRGSRRRSRRSRRLAAHPQIGEDLSPGLSELYEVAAQSRERSVCHSRASTWVSAPSALRFQQCARPYAVAPTVALAAATSASWRRPAAKPSRRGKPRPPRLSPLRARP